MLQTRPIFLGLNKLALDLHAYLKQFAHRISYGQFGKVDLVFFHNDNQGRSNGTGGVWFQKPKDAKMAQDYYNLLYANDKTSLDVNENEERQG